MGLLQKKLKDETGQDAVRFSLENGGPKLTGAPWKVILHEDGII